MRVAPVGLIFSKKDAFEMGCELAAITHGHPSGYLSAGVLACIISCLIEGMELEDAVNTAMQELATYPGNTECLDILNKAVELAKDNKPLETALRQLGEGWVGEEAIAIAVYCSLVHKNDFRVMDSHSLLAERNFSSHNNACHHSDTPVDIPENAYEKSIKENGLYPRFG